MGTGLRRHRIGTRRSERIRVHAAIRLTNDDGALVAPFARCTEIGLGGVRVCADLAPPTGTRLRVRIRLPSGTELDLVGRVAWSRQTLHPALFGAPRGRDDDADFGIAFDSTDTLGLLPIARLFAAREHEKLRAQRIRRRYGRSIRA